MSLDIIINTNNNDNSNNTNNNKIKKWFAKYHYKQKIKVVFEIIIEIYKIVMGTCLIITVPQYCNNRDCNLSDIIYRQGILYNYCFGMNLFTLFAFVILFMIESKRETIFMRYLESEKYLPNDNESVSKIMDFLEPEYKNEIIMIDQLYINTNYVCIFLFIVNTVFSGLVIITNANNNKTITVFFTNILFISIKLTNIRIILSADKNVFYSAYLTEFVQYNNIITSNSVKSDSDENVLNMNPNMNNNKYHLDMKKYIELFDKR
jgi:hypothetical protein